MRQCATHSSPSSLGEVATRSVDGGAKPPLQGEGDRRRWWRGITLTATATLAACAPIPKAAHHQAPTIVSLNPCSDAILAEVTGPGQLLAISHYSADPRSRSMDAAQARRYPSTRGTLEEVLALRPDVVVDGTFVAPATAAAYRRLGMALETLPIAATVEDSHAQIRRLAVLAGHPERGEALIRRIDAALKSATPPDAVSVPALVWEPGGIVPGDATLIAELLRRTGFTNFSAARGLGQADLLPLERVLADPPRVILAAGGDRALRHPALASLAATTRAPLDPALLYCAGPTIIRAATRLAEVRRALGRMPTPNPSRMREGSQVALSSARPPAAGRSPPSPLPRAGGAGGGQSTPNPTP